MPIWRKFELLPKPATSDAPPNKKWLDRSDYQIKDDPIISLWSQVVNQALEDLETEPIGSIEYMQAASFFVGGGEWESSLVLVAEIIGVHPDSLRRIGLRAIMARVGDDQPRRK